MLDRKFDRIDNHIMSKLFIGYVDHLDRQGNRVESLSYHSGLAWHTDDQALRQKFEEFGQVEEAVSLRMNE